MPYKNAADQRAWYHRNKHREIASARNRNSRLRARNKALTDAAKDKPCTDCGVWYPPYVMQFDHVSGEKLGNVCQMANFPVSEARLIAEMEKCEVVCANCHAERTHGGR